MAPTNVVVSAGLSPPTVPAFLNDVLTDSSDSGAANDVTSSTAPAVTRGSANGSSVQIALNITFSRTGPAVMLCKSRPGLGMLCRLGDLSTKTSIVKTPKSGISFKTTSGVTFVSLQTPRTNVMFSMVVSSWQFVRMNLFISVPLPKKCPVFV